MIDSQPERTSTIGRAAGRGQVNSGCDPERIASLPRRVMAAVDGGLKLALNL